MANRIAISGCKDSDYAAFQESSFPFIEEKYALEVLTFLGITAGLVASLATITVSFLQIGALVRKQKHRKTIVKRSGTIAELPEKEAQISKTLPAEK